MAQNPKEKKRLKRLQVRKARLQKRRDADLRIDRLDDYGCACSDAWKEGDPRTALSYAKKMLELDPYEDWAWSTAFACVDELGDANERYLLLSLQFRTGQLTDYSELFRIGHLANDRKEFELARDAFKSILDKPPTFKRKKEAEQFLSDVRQNFLYSEAMLASQSCHQTKIQRAPELKKSRSPATEIVADPTYAKSPQGAASTVSAGPVARPSQQASAPGGASAPPHVSAPPVSVPAPDQDLPELSVHFETNAGLVIDAIRSRRRSDKTAFDLALQAYRHSFRVSYDQLLCLPTLRNVESLWYQEETAAKVMKTFRGRAILADEVGLGKTIEACLILKEYLLRGLVRTALVITPSSLVSQWQEELREKFALEFISSNDPLFRQNPDEFWKQPFIVASLAAARSRRHFEAVTGRLYDIVVVDEAHHLKNHLTQGWKLVNSIQKTFLLLLTATPVQNSLDELYNLVTLLRPGHLKTRKSFKEEFVSRGQPFDPRNREKLRNLLQEVMVRNTRSISRLRIPPRFAFTTRVDPSESEGVFYQEVSDLVGDCASGKIAGAPVMSVRKLMEAAGSSHQAALGRLEKLRSGSDAHLAERAGKVIEVGKQISAGAKTRKVLELLKSIPDQKIVFVNFLATLQHLHEILEKENVPHVVFHGGLSSSEKQTSMAAFRGGAPVLLATGMGGEGHNLQFCHVMVNYDLPWNPMQIEQRIGRVHRIGQEKEVQIYNFCAAGTIEDHVLQVLDRKINMFELVIGEIDMILGNIQDERDFEDMIFQIWCSHADDTGRQKAFEALATRLRRARTQYEKSKHLDEQLFQEDFGL